MYFLSYIEGRINNVPITVTYMWSKGHWSTKVGKDILSVYIYFMCIHKYARLTILVAVFCGYVCF